MLILMRLLLLWTGRWALIKLLLFASIEVSGRFSNVMFVVLQMQRKW